METGIETEAEVAITTVIGTEEIGIVTGTGCRVDNDGALRGSFWHRM